MWQARTAWRFVPSKHNAMDLLVLRDDAHARVIADLDTGTFRLTWKGPSSSEHFRRILIQGLMQIMQHRLKRWLSDSRELTRVAPADEAWVKEDLIPRMMHAGIERLAVVPSVHPGYARPLERIVEHSGQRSPFPFRICRTLEEAELWLLQQEAMAS